MEHIRTIRKRYRMILKEPMIQYHASDYVGDARVLAVIQWLKARPLNKASRDPVEKLIRLNAEEWKPGADVRALTRKLRAILRRSRLRLTPFWYAPVLTVMRFSKHRGAWAPKPLTDWRRWGVEWDAEAQGMGRAQALALRGVLELASDGLLGRVRKCRRVDCGEWFFAKKRNQIFHSSECQQFTLRHDKVWMAKHAADMRARRAEKKAKKAGKVNATPPGPRRRGVRR